MMFPARALAFTAMALVSSAASAASVPTVSDFNSGTQGWFVGDGTPLSIVANGGLDGTDSVSGTNAFITFTPPGSPVPLTVSTIVRSDSETDPGFFGDWIAAGVTQFSFDIKHDVQGPVFFGGRFATPDNRVAINGTSLQPVAAGEWATVTIDINPNSPQLDFQQTDFNTLFSNVGNIQLVASVPPGGGPAPTLINFEVDNIQIIPAPASVTLLGGLGLAAIRRRRS